MADTEEPAIGSRFAEALFRISNTVMWLTISSFAGSAKSTAPVSEETSDRVGQTVAPLIANGLRALRV